MKELKEVNVNNVVVMIDRKTEERRDFYLEEVEFAGLCLVDIKSGKKYPLQSNAKKINEDYYIQIYDLKDEEDYIKTFQEIFVPHMNRMNKAIADKES